MLRIKSLKQIAAYSVLFLLAACGGGGGGGSDSEGNGGPGGSGGSGDYAVGVSIFPASLSQGQLTITVAPGQEIPVSAFFAIDQVTGATRNLTLADIDITQEQIDGGEVWVHENETSFAMNEERSFFFNIKLPNGTHQQTIEVTVTNEWNTEGYKAFSASFNTDNGSKEVLLPTRTFWDGQKDVFPGIALPVGSRLGLRNHWHSHLPDAISSPELEIDWKLGQPAPLLTKEGEGKLYIQHRWSDEPEVVDISVYGQLKEIRLDAGYDANGVPTVFPGIYNPYKVVGVTETDNEIDLSALYSGVSDDGYDIRNRTLYVTKPTGQVAEFMMEVNDDVSFGFTDHVHTHQAAIELMGLSSDNVKVNIDIQYLDRLELGQKLYYAGIGEDIPEIDVDGYYNGFKFDLSTNFYFGNHAALDNGKTVAKGIAEFEFGTNVSTGVGGSHKAYLEVGDLTPDGLKGRWQYLDNGDTRIVGPFTSTSFDTQTETNTLRETNTGRYLVRAGISNVAVTADTELVGDGTEGVSAVASSSRMFSARSGGIGGGNLLFKNVDTGETHEVDIENDGSVSTTLPTGDYKVSSEVQVEKEGTIFTYKLFDAPATVEGEAIELGTFAAVGDGSSNFKADLDSNQKEFIYYSGTTYTKQVEVTNIGSDSKGNLIFDAYPHADSAHLFASFSHQEVFGGLDAGGVMDFDLTFQLNQPAAKETAKIEVTVSNGTDTWTDFVYIDVSHVPSIDLELHASRGEGNGGFMNGYLLTPGRKLIQIQVQGSSGIDFKVPNEDDSTYQMIFVNQQANTESAYAIGVGANVTRSDVDRYRVDGGATDKNEPTDNTPEGAIQLYRDSGSLNKYLSYMGANDIDYVDINMSAAP